MPSPESAEEGRVAAGFEAALAVTALGAGGALETSGILFLELIGELKRNKFQKY